MSLLLLGLLLLHICNCISVKQSGLDDAVKDDSGYYIVTYSAFVQVKAGETTDMFVYHNGVKLEESRFHTIMRVGDSGDFIDDRIPEQW